MGHGLYGWYGTWGNARSE